MVGAVSLTSWVFAQNSKRSSSGNQAVPTNVLPTLIQQLKQGRVDLNDPAVTLALLKEHAVVGVKGSFKSDGSLRSVGLTGLERSQARRVEDRQFRGRSLAGSCV